MLLPLLLLRARRFTPIACNVSRQHRPDWCFRAGTRMKLWDLRRGRTQTLQAPPWQRGRGRGRQQRDERGTADIHPWRQHQLASLLPGSAASLSHTVALWAPRDLAPREPCRPPLGRTTFSRSHSACTPSSSCSCRRSSTCAVTLTHLSPLLVARPALTPLSPLPHTAVPTCCVCSPRPSRRARAPRRAAVLPAASAAPIAAAVAVAAASRAVAVAVAATSEARAAPPHCTARRPTAPPPLRSRPLPSHRALPVRAQAWAP